MVEEKHLFCFGLGYSAQVLAQLLRDEGWQVSGTVRTAEKAADLKNHGYAAYVFDGALPGDGIAGALTTATHILVSIPPDEDGDPVLRHHAEDIVENVGVLDWIGYLSTIGVYGDHQGGWVDEDTPPTPLTARSRWRLTAEETWTGVAALGGVPAHIFRLPGIYGPGRNQIEQVRAGRARRLVKPGQVFNRIHVADIARVLRASMRNPAVEAIYNLSDDEPAPPQDVVAFAAELLGVEPPPEVPIDEAGLSPMARSFYGECKRVRNDRIKRELAVRLEFPTYREGLRVILNDL